MILDAIKQKLLDAAGEEFAERGYDCATIKAITERAGMNIAAVNYHFGGKEQLYERAIIEAYRCGNSAVEVAMDGGEPAELLRRYIQRFLRNVLAIRRNGGWHHSLMLREMLQPTAATGAVVREGIRPQFDWLIAVLSRVCPEADRRHLNAIAFSVVGQCLHYKMAHQVAEMLIGADEVEAMDLEFLAEHITGFTLAALGLAPALDAAGRAEAPAAAPAGG